MISRSTFIAAASAAVLLTSSAHASDVSVFLPADFLGDEVDAHLEAVFAAGTLPGTLSWAPNRPGTRLRRVNATTLGVSANLQYTQVLAAGPFMFSPVVPASLAFDVSFDCRGVNYVVDARNIQLVVGGVTYTGPALNRIEASIETALQGQMGALDNGLIDASTAYGVPMQSKCVDVAIGNGGSLDYQFNLGCVEGTTKHERCLPGRYGRGSDYRCVNREWTVTDWDCHAPMTPH